MSNEDQKPPPPPKAQGQQSETPKNPAPQKVQANPSITGPSVKLAINSYEVSAERRDGLQTAIGSEPPASKKTDD